ncbi:MAG: hypothetical protein JRE57_00090 [Deltaproteobacteria bacterium]|nr:hypothetical protein [Deltaproteobacteria bacterium]
MIPVENINPLDRPTTIERKFWREEAEFLRWHEPNPRAPRGSVEGSSWGVPPDWLPPRDAIDYVICKYREDPKVGARLHTHTPRCASKRYDNEPCDCQYAPLHPMHEWTLMLVVIAHFLWFRTEEGASWVMGFYGTQKVVPFDEAYAYFLFHKASGKQIPLVTPDTKPGFERDPATNKDELARNYIVTIYREWERDLSPPCSTVNPGPVEKMKSLLDTFRCPYAGRPLRAPQDPALWYWISETIRDWFRDARPDSDWPFPKNDRVSAMHWVTQAERAPKVLLFEGMAQLNRLRDSRVYRIEAASGRRDQQNHVTYVGSREVMVRRLKDLYQESGNVSLPQLEATFRCSNCRKQRTCVPYTGNHRRCCHCFSVEMEDDSHPTLEKCTLSRECANCPDMLRDKNELVRALDNLRRPNSGTVPR